MLSSLSPATYVACDIGGSQQSCGMPAGWWLSLWREAAFQVRLLPLATDPGLASPLIFLVFPIVPSPGCHLL